MKGYRKLLLAVLLGLGYIGLDWYLKDGKEFLKNFSITVFLALVAFIIQFYLEKEPVESLLAYIRKKYFSWTIELTIEQALVKRVNATWIEQYLNKVRQGVNQKFNVSSTYYEFENNYIENLSKDFLRELPSTSFDDYSSVTKMIFGSKPKLIITGDQGSGKTIMMLHIVEAYINQADSEEGQRDNIPVVLNMSTIPSNNESWEALFGRNKLKYEDKPYLKFETWIIDQVKLNYKIYPQDLKSLAKNNQIIYFFDGIDDLNDEFNFQNSGDRKQKEILKLHLNEIMNLLGSYTNHVEEDFKKQNLLDATLSYVVACRQSTLDSIEGLKNIHELVSLEPLSRETIQFALTRQEIDESKDVHQISYYPDSLKNYIFDSSNKVPTDRKLFALKMANNPYLLTVMRKTVDMKKVSRLNFFDRWFSDEDEQKFKFNLLDDYVNAKLNNKAYTKSEYQSQFPNKENNIRWLTNMSKWTNSSEFILEDLQPFEHIDFRYSVFPSMKLIIYWSIYVLPVLIFMLSIIALPVGVSIFYEWDFYNSSCSEEMLNKFIFEVDLCKSALVMGIKSFLWTSLVLIFTMPIALIYGSMRLPGYYSDNSKKSRKSTQITQKYLPESINRSIQNRGFIFAIFLGLAIASTRFVLIKHSYDSETGQVFDNSVAFTNFVATFVGCTVLYMVFTASNLLSEDLYVVNRFDHYNIDYSRAKYAIIGGIVVTIILLIPIFLQTWAENEIENVGLVLGRALGIGGVLTICLPLLFSFKPVSDKKIKTKPNHGIRQHLKNSIVSFAILFVVGTLILYYAYGTNVEPPSGVVNAICGISFGVLSLMYGLLSVCKHYAIRLILALPLDGESKFPFQATSFLKHMSGTGLVRIVGGRCMFEHSLLMEYFSSKSKS